MDVMHWINIILAIFWLVIAGTYGYLIYRHWKISNETIEPAPYVKGAAAINGLSTGLVENRESVHNIINFFNRNNRIVNRTQMKGYIVATIASILGLTLSIVGICI